MPNKSDEREILKALLRAKDNQINKLIEILFQKQIISEKEKDFLLSL